MTGNAPLLRLVGSATDPNVVVCQVVTFRQIGPDFGRDRRTEYAEEAITHNDQIIRNKREAEARAEADGLRLEREGEFWDSLPA